LLQRPAERDQFGQRLGDAGAEGGDDVLDLGPSVARVGLSVGGDHALVDAPGGLDLDVLVGREQRAQARPLLVGEQVVAGVEGPPRPVERVLSSASVTAGVLLDSATAPVQRVTSQTDHVEGVHDRDGVGQFLGGGGLEPGGGTPAAISSSGGNPSIATNLHTVTPSRRAVRRG
jgi:hypothetical protein